MSCGRQNSVSGRAGARFRPGTRLCAGTSLSLLTWIDLIRDGMPATPFLLLVSPRSLSVLAQELFGVEKPG